mmetsp:Transcript_54174/g.136307  ORF Transcript_54174/g.136307 Transcript_54174/m.136307 type:complete len:201 (+) Transcript_54174:53-655(+)
MMKAVCLVVALGLQVALAFVPPSALRGQTYPVRQPTQLHMTGEVERRNFMHNAGGSLLGLALGLGFAENAFADGAVSDATVQRARGTYGIRLLDLEPAVNKGDFSAVAKEKNAFTLFNSGAYAKRGPIDRENKAKAESITKDIFAAVEAKDVNKLKSSYAEYKKFLPTDLVGRSSKLVKQEKAQAHSSDFHWTQRRAAFD